MANKDIYKHTTEETLKLLNTTLNGMSQSEANQRKEEYGLNVLDTPKRFWLKRLLEPFSSVFVSILIVAAFISLLAHETLDAVVISIVLTVNAVIYYVQQFSADKVLNALKEKGVVRVHVKRDGKVVEISSAEIVPGDIVYLSEGVKIPADGRLLETNGLHISEAILTGESMPVVKIPESLVGKNLEVYDQKNMIFRDTIVHSGSGVMVITATGNDTEIGKINTLAGTADTERSPIERKIDDFIKKMAIIIGFIGIVVFLLALARGISTGEALRFSLALIVSVVPEGLPVALTVTLLISAKKLAKVNALVRQFASLETLGAVTLIATDKTGTLTKNQLSVAEMHSATKEMNKFELAISASLNGSTKLHLDPLDNILAERYGEHVSGEWKKIKEYPFDQNLRASGVLWLVNNENVLYVKGAPELIADHSNSKFGKLTEDFVSKGYRVIAVGHKVLQSTPKSLDETVIKGLHFDGILGLADEIRDNISESIAEAHQAGIKVVMLTGDHVQTAREVALKINLADSPSQVADAKMLESYTGVASKIGEGITAFGRVLPKHKFNFLKAVKGQEITAMTGDGVNDIPALVEADVGLSMGSGTDAAKDASDIVLLDDNFNTIISSIKAGRALLGNIKKMLFYVLSTSVGEVFTMIGSLVLGWPLPVTAVQILWINLVTDGFTVLPLGLSAPEPHQMKQPPSNPKSPLLNSLYVSRMLVVGLTMAIVTLVLFNKALATHGYIYAQTVAFLALVVSQWANAFTANFDKHFWVKNLVKPNKLLLLGILVAVVFQLIGMYGPLSNALGVVPLLTTDLLSAVVLPVVCVVIAGDLHKLVTRFIQGRAK